MADEKKDTAVVKQKRQIRSETSRFSDAETLRLREEVELIASKTPDLPPPVQSIYPADTKEDDRYRVSKMKELTGKDNYKNRKDLKAESILLAMEDNPPADVLALPEAVAVLGSIADDELRDRVFGYLGDILEGKTYKITLAKYDFNWNMIVKLQGRFRGLGKVMSDCRDLGEMYRKVIREDAAYTRAVEGYEEDVFSNSGKKVGKKTIYSDRLLEMMMKADDPDKYRPVVALGDSGGLVLNIKLGIDREAFKKEAEEKGPKEVTDGEFEVLNDG
jgi:hypothetical protein